MTEPELLVLDEPTFGQDRDTWSELVALLVPPTPRQTSRDRLVAEGRLVAGAGALRLPLRRPAPTETTQDVLDDLRADR